jgi:hypothetical protein
VTVRVLSHVEAPRLREQTRSLRQRSWPRFVLRDPVAQRLSPLLYVHFPEHQHYLVHRRRVVGAAQSIPFAWDGDELPDRGWDAAIEQGFADRDAGRPANALCALGIMIDPRLGRRGLSSVLLETLRSSAKANRLERLVAPVRPTLKADYPLIPMEDFARWQTDDGLPFDPWMRTHARLGATVERVCEESMRVSGTVAQWERWAGMKLPDSGEHIVPGALAPVTIDRRADAGLYVEPNVWMRHPL